MDDAMYSWNTNVLCGVRLPDGADAEDVVKKANELFRLREAHIQALSRRFPKRAARLPSVEEYSAALLEHIEDYQFYLDRQVPGFLDDVKRYDAAFLGDDVRTIYGLPVNKSDIAEYLNWQTQRLASDFQSVMDAAVAVKTSYNMNDELLEMPWCPCPGEPESPV